MIWFLVPIALLALAAGGGSARAAGAHSRAARPRVAPPEYVALAKKWAAAFKVSLAYALTIMERESGFNPRSTNLNERALPKGGAWGLMQVTYDTAVDDRKKLVTSTDPRVKETLARWSVGPEALLPERLLDPDLNVMLGTFHMAKLVREFKSMENVAAAYHQGAATVRKLLQQDGDLRNIKPLGKVYVANAMDIYRRYA